MRPRVGVVGYGLAGRTFHAPLVAAEPGLALAVVVTGDPGRAAAAALRHPDVVVVPDVGSMLDVGVDVAVVAAPVPAHLPLVRLLVRAGVATVVDKPVTARAEDAEALAAEAEAAGVLLTVFQNRRWDGDFLTVQQLVASGRFGQVRRFESRFEWISSRPRPAWKTETAGVDGGGVAYDLGSHLVDQAIQLFGPVAETYGELDARVPGALNDDDSFIALRHDSGVRSHLAMSSRVARRGFRFRVLGSESAYTKWGLDPQESQLSSGTDPRDEAYGHEPESLWGRLGDDDRSVPVPTVRGDYPAFYRQLAAALTVGGPIPVDPREPVAAIRVIEGLHARRAFRETA